MVVAGQVQITKGSSGIRCLLMLRDCPERRRGAASVQRLQKQILLVRRRPAVLRSRGPGPPRLRSRCIRLMGADLHEHGSGRDSDLAQLPLKGRRLCRRVGRRGILRFHATRLLTHPIH